MFVFGPLLRQYAIVITLNLSVLCVGMGLAWPSPVLVKLRSQDTVLPEPLTEDQGSWIVSIGFLIATFTSPIQPYVIDYLGRKYSAFFACATKLLVCLLFTFANSLWMLLVGRAICGVVDGITFAAVPMYASEIASKEIRGSLGTILQIFASLGIVIMLSMGPFVSYTTLNVVFTCAVIVATIPILFLPDSPYFLYSKGRTEEAEKVLTFFRGSEAIAIEEIKEYSANTEMTINKRELFKNRVFLKSFGIVLVLGFGIQAIGYNAVTFYLQTVLESTQTSIKPEMASVVIGFIQLLASFCTAVITDKLGRKPILSSTLIGMGVGMIGLGAFFKIRESEEMITGFMNYLPLVSLILVVYCHSAGYGSLYWALITELFEGPSRAVGVTYSLLTTIFTMFLTTKYFPLATNAIGPAATYWVFGVNCVLLSLFTMFCVPETKGKSFSEIQASLGAKLEENVERAEEKK